MTVAAWQIFVNPAARATSEATAPGSSAAATIRSFSDRDQRRRRCTGVITSTAFVIGVVLVLALGLEAMAHLRKAAVTGCLLCVHRPAIWDGIAGMHRTNRLVSRGGGYGGWPLTEAPAATVPNCVETR